MESSLDVAARILRRHPAPSLPLSELHHLVAEETPGPSLPSGRLLDRVRTRPDVFRVLDPRRGAWRAGGRCGADDTFPDLLEPWVVLEPGGTKERGIGAVSGNLRCAAPPGPLPRLRESVLSLGRTLDEGSSTTLSRWTLIAREERHLRERLSV